MAIPKSFIEELKSKCRIEEIIGEHVALKRSGRGYVGLCPFHSEHTPSFSVNASDQYFHCFGCGAGGDVITFVMNYERLDYVEAIKFLAERAGLTVPESDGNDKSEQLSRLKTRILAANRAAAKFFYATLKASPAAEKARRYLAERELLPATIVHYGLGYAENSWDALSKHLTAQGFTDYELTVARLSGEKNKRIFDFFRDRVMFPIIDLRGNVIAFGGRKIDGEGPKYINTPDTPVFRKGQYLFSLPFAKKAASDSLILCEGYMDVIALNQAGFENSVATLGTALTPDQARLMASYAKEVFISYDSDAPGQKAAARAINLLAEVGLRTKIIVIPDAKDPDEYIKKFGAARFKNVLEKSAGATDFRLSKAADELDLDDSEGKAAYLDKAAKIIAELPAKHRLVYASELAEKLRIPPDQVRVLIENDAKRVDRSRENVEWQNIERQALQKTAELSKLSRAKQHIWAYLYKNPEAGRYIVEHLSESDFDDELSTRIYNSLKKSLDKNVDFYILDECEPADQGKITEIMEIANRISITNAEFVNSVSLLSQKLPPPSELSDDALRSLFKLGTKPWV